MILIADCGSTKIDWCVVSHGEVKLQVFTSGINALLMPEDQIRETLAKELAPQVAGFDIDQVYYYAFSKIFVQMLEEQSRLIFLRQK